MPKLRERLGNRIGGGSQREQVESVLREELSISRSQESLLLENLHQLELAISGDDDWRRMGMSLRREFTRSGLDDIIDISRAMYLVNPLIQRAVNINTYYTWAQGYDFIANEERVQEEIVDVQTGDEGNRLELYSHQAVLLTDVDQIVDGNVALALFTDDFGDVRIRSIPTEQIREIIYDDEDYLKIKYYRRCWSQETFDESTGVRNVRQYDVFYPDISYYPRVRPDSIGGTEVKWDAPVIHQRMGGLKHQTFGIPQTYAALDWARAYKKFLEDWHTVVSSLARFAWRASVKKSKAQRLKERLTRNRPELEEDPEEGADQGPPVPGGIWADPSELTPINKSGATVAPEDGKMSRLMIGAAMDLPDTILSGDPQQGNLATAKSLDRPTELGMRSRQSLWADFHARIFRYTYDAKVRRGRMPGRIVRTTDGSYVEPGLDPTVTMEFPPILEHDVVETVRAIVIAATLDGKIDAGTIPREELSKRLMSTIGVEDVEAAVQDLDDGERGQVEQAIERLGEVLSANGSH